MNRLMQWVMAVALICSSMVFTSCSKDDNPVNPADNLAEKIIGKWISAERNGEAMMTNKKMVFTFVSATKAYVSTSRNSRSELNPSWMDQLEADVVINGNQMTLTFHPDEHKTSLHEFTVTAISDSEFTANEKVTVTVDGNVVVSEENISRFTKVTADYREAILGTWEGKVTSSEGSEYDDGELHRWEYKADGNFVYYVQNDNGEWVPSSNTLNQYFVDGVLLCTRWIDNDIENREWWEITIKGDKMNWTALRQNPDGTTFTATFEMTKVVE